MSKTYCYEEVPLQENPEGFNIDDFVLANMQLQTGKAQK